MKTKKILVGLLVVGAVLNSAALTLGRVSGAAWIGQTLALSIPVQVDSVPSDTGLCADAEVFYADSKQDPSRVLVRQESTTQTDTRILHVISSTTIDEPMVTVYLRVGCAQKVSRRYVLLADYPTMAEPVTTLAPIATPASPTTPTTTPIAAASPLTSEDFAPTTAAPSAASNPARSRTTANHRSAAPHSAEKASPSPKPAPVSQPPKLAVRPTAPAAIPPPAAVAPTRARLKLDPLENLADRIKTLETTTTAIPLEDLVRDAQRMQQLQGDVKALLQQAAKNEATLAVLRERLEKAESERTSSALIYGLMVLVLLCLAAIAVLWNRRNPPTVWRQDWPAPLPAQSVRPSTEAAYAETTQPHSEASESATIPAFTDIPKKDADIDVDLIEMDAVSYDELMHPPPTEAVGLSALGAEDPLPAPLPNARLPHQDFNSDMQFDLCQQAEFFESLAKTDEAIEVLERRIRSNSKDCPLIYLELLRIANTHSLKTDFRQFREECQQVFNVAIPEFALFRNEGRGLEAHPSLLQHIEKLWPSRQVLDVMESCILRDPWEKNADPFDLAAFKELVLLHGIAYQLTHPAAPQESTESVESMGPVGSQHMDLEL